MSDLGNQDNVSTSTIVSSSINVLVSNNTLISNVTHSSFISSIVKESNFTGHNDLNEQLFVLVAMYTWQSVQSNGPTDKEQKWSLACQRFDETMNNLRLTSFLQEHLYCHFVPPTFLSEHMNAATGLPKEFVTYVTDTKAAEPTKSFVNDYKNPDGTYKVPEELVKVSLSVILFTQQISFLALL